MESEGKIKIENIQKLTIIIASFFCMTSFFFLVNTPPASNYEISIYGAFSPVFWILFIGSIVFSAIFIISYAFNPIEKRYLIFSIFLIILIFSAFFLLPVIRDYSFISSGRGWGGILERVGLIKTIIQSGYLSTTDWYPVSHILVANLNMIGIPILNSVLLIQLIINFVYISFLFYYIRELDLGFKYSNVAMLFCALSLIYLNFHVIFTPAVMSFLMIPLFLYLLRKGEKDEKYKFKILVLLLAITIIFFHPLTTFLLILIIIFIFFTKKLYLFFNLGDIKKNTSALIFLIIFILFFTWSSSFLQFDRTMKRSWISLSGMGHYSPLEGHMNMLGETGLTFVQIIERFINMYGVIMIYAGIALICLFFIGKKFFSEKKISYPKMLYSIQFIIGILIGLFMLTVRFLEVEIIRLSRYAIFMSTILIGIYLTEEINIFKKNIGKSKSIILNKKSIVIFFIIVMILLSIPLSMLNVYASNMHLTYSETTGTDWYLKHGSFERGTIAGSAGYRMIMYLYSSETIINRRDGSTLIVEKGDVFPAIHEIRNYPKHLGYNENETVRETFNDNVYIIISPYDYNWYKALYPNQLEYFNYYTLEDLKRLDNDSTANKIFANGEFYISEVII